MKLADLVAVGDNVVVKPDEGEKATPGGIVLPDSVINAKQQSGKVLSVGPGKRDVAGQFMPLSVMVGDQIIYDRYAATTLEVDGEKFAVVKEPAILVRGKRKTEAK